MADPSRSIALHLVPEAAWRAAPWDEPFRAASLAVEGFVHLTHEMADLVEVANAFYRDVPGRHVVLTIALDRLTVPWRYDGDERFPHAYGPLDRAAIVAVQPMPRAADGRFVAAHDGSREGDGGPDPLDSLFDAAIERTLAGLPAQFAERLGSVAIVLEDEPTAEQLGSVGARGLFGLYQGVPRTRWGAENTPFASKITLFRGPLTRANRDPGGLARAIEATLLHEIAHHFGIDDERLRELSGH